jgi:cysteine-rich repeat protein
LFPLRFAMASTTFDPLHRPALLGTLLCLSCLTLACAGGEVASETFGSEESSGDGDGDGDRPGDGDGDGDGDPGCTAAGCECDGSPGSCDEGLGCINGTCSPATCSNGVVEPPAEQCDDGNDLEGDGCDLDCSYTEILAVEAGGSHTCALIEGGRVRCWGLNSSGQLGHGNLNNIGDNEPASMPGDVVLGEDASALSLGANHSCAYLTDETVRCWGEGESGQLGQGNTEDIGDDEAPFLVNSISVNTDVLSIHAGGSHTCALVGAGNVRCWGANNYGQLGYGNNTNLAVPLTVDLTLNGIVTYLAAGRNHNCALLEDGKVRCWGLNNRGQLGYGNTENIGDNETPGSVVPVPILPQGIPDDVAISQLALGTEHSCVLYENGRVLCWGDNFYGQLGQGSTTTVGDNETLATLFPIELGGSATYLALGKHHTCALMDDGGVKCWGRNIYGQLGRGDIAHIGDDELPDSIDNIDLGGSATWLTAGDYHTCVVVDSHEVVCWGFNDYGQLGYGDTLVRGDDEVPAEVGGITLL